MQNREPSSDCARHLAALIAECAGDLPPRELALQAEHRMGCVRCEDEYVLACALERHARDVRQQSLHLPFTPSRGFGDRVWSALNLPATGSDAGSACSDVLPSLTAWIEGDLTPSDNTILVRHLAVCVSCSDYVRDARQCDSLLRLVEAPAPPSNLRDRIFARLESEGLVARTARPRRPLRMLTRALAAAAVLLMMTILLSRGLDPNSTRSAQPSSRYAHEGSRPAMKHAIEAIARQRELVLKAALDEHQPNGVGAAARGEIIPVRGALSAKRSGNAWHRSVQNALLVPTRGRTR